LCSLIVLSIKTKDKGKRLFFAFLSGICGGLMGASWGAFVYLLGIYSVLPFALLLFKVGINDNYRLTHIVTLSIMLLIINSVPRNQLHFITSVLGILSLASILLVFIVKYIKVTNISDNLKSVTSLVIIIIILSLVTGLVSYGISSKYIAVINPFYRTKAVFVTTVQEQATVNAGAFLYYLNISIPFLILGIYLFTRNINIYNLLLLLMLISSLYAASNFARLFILAIPAVVITASYAIDHILSLFYIRPKHKRKRVYKESRRKLLFVIILILLIVFSCFNYILGIQFAANIPPTLAAASTSIPRNIDDWLEALAWIRDNVPRNAVIAAWWDYGYWLSFIGNRTTLADNGTLNLTRIKLLAEMFLSNESEALKILKQFNVSYIVIFIGTQQLSLGNRMYYTLTGIGEDSKFIQMARIAGIPVSKFIYSTQERIKERKPLYKPAFWNTFLGKLIPYKYITTQIDPRTGRLIDIYVFSPKYPVYPNTGNAPLTLVFRSSHKVVGEVLIYKVNYEYLSSKQK